MSAQARLRGEVKILPLANLKPNGWNPNTMTEAMKESLKHGLRTDGWLLSQSLLVWGMDDDGEVRNLIIDGEHRYLAAVELGLTEGPMVVLDGIPEVEAKALTVKLNQKRGEWNETALADLLRSIQYELPEGVSGIDLGFADEHLMKLLAEPPAELPAPEPPATPPTDPEESKSSTGGGGAAAPPPETSSVRMVQLFLDDESQPRFMEDVRRLSEAWGTKNVTDTALRAVAEARARLDEEAAE